MSNFKFIFYIFLHFTNKQVFFMLVYLFVLFLLLMVLGFELRVSK
jgi:hypothetical protein